MYKESTSLEQFYQPCPLIEAVVAVARGNNHPLSSILFSEHKRIIIRG